MKRNIAILGSTGSIGNCLLDIISNDKKKFNIILLSANKNYKLLLKQAKLFNVKNLILTDKKAYSFLLKKKIKTKIKIFNNFDQLSKILKKKVDYTMSAISGLEGLSPTINIIKHTKKIAIANKESIICGWDLINKEIKKHKTVFCPVDSEHFSLWYELFSKKKKEMSIEKIFLTASGGPFVNYSIKQLKNVNIEDALNHPNWKMGKKISVDSATMMNKVFEIIEAKNIFNIPYDKISILIHPKSYIHAIIKYNDGMIKLICHDTTMKIPIHNTLYEENANRTMKSAKLNLNKLNYLNISNIKVKKYPIIKVLNNLPKNNSLFETVVVSANDQLVKLFLNKKIRFNDISRILLDFIKNKDFNKYKKIKPSNINQITKLNEYVRLKIMSLSI